MSQKTYVQRQSPPMLTHEEKDSKQAEGPLAVFR